MKINGINSNCRFGMQFTKEVENGFRKSQEEIKDFWGEKSEKYKEFCDHLKIAKEHSKDYVVGIEHENNIFFDPYYFVLRNTLNDKIYTLGCGAETKDDLFSLRALKSLALTAITTEWRDEKESEDALKPKKESFFERLKKKFKK